jgi:hypothetical protein
MKADRKQEQAMVQGLLIGDPSSEVAHANNAGEGNRDSDEIRIAADPFDDFGCDAFVMGKKLRPRKSDRNLPNYLTA